MQVKLDNTVSAQAAPQEVASRDLPGLPKALIEAAEKLPHDTRLVARLVQATQQIQPSVTPGPVGPDDRRIASIPTVAATLPPPVITYEVKPVSASHQASPDTNRSRG